MCLTAETCLAQTEPNEPGQLASSDTHCPSPLLCPKTTPGGGPHWVVPFVARALVHDRAPISHRSSPRKKRSSAASPEISKLRQKSQIMQDIEHVLCLTF